MPHPFDCITEFIFAETPIEPADVILVPGGSFPELMEHAAALYHQGMAPYILPSGGVNPKLETTEWEFLQRIGIERGVPEQAILQENRARHTFQNAEFSWQTLRENGIRPNKVILSCKAFHARRALLSYQTVFPSDVEFLVSPVVDRRNFSKETWFRDGKGIELVMREVEKIGTYFNRHIPNWTQVI
jgi:uncharacterized SAM-binding protein YcdF (DUF218 family)